MRSLNAVPAPHRREEILEDPVFKARLEAVHEKTSKFALGWQKFEVALGLLIDSTKVTLDNQSKKSQRLEQALVEAERALFAADPERPPALYTLTVPEEAVAPEFVETDPTIRVEFVLGEAAERWEESANEIREMDNRAPAHAELVARLDAVPALVSKDAQGTKSYDKAQTILRGLREEISKIVSASRIKKADGLQAVEQELSLLRERCNNCVFAVVRATSELKDLRTDPATKADILGKKEVYTPALSGEVRARSIRAQAQIAKGEGLRRFNNFYDSLLAIENQLNAFESGEYKSGSDDNLSAIIEVVLSKVNNRPFSPFRIYDADAAVLLSIYGRMHKAAEDLEKLKERRRPMEQGQILRAELAAKIKELEAVEKNKRNARKARKKSVGKKK